MSWGQAVQHVDCGLLSGFSGHFFKIVLYLGTPLGELFDVAFELRNGNFGIIKSLLEVPSSSVVRYGHPLFLSSLHLPQDQQLPWQTLCEEQPGVVLFPGPWLLEGGQQPTGLQGLP